MARPNIHHHHHHLHPPDSLYDHVQARYLTQPPVRDWLFNRTPHVVRHADTLHTAFSYACMYYPPTFNPRGFGPYPMPQPFLDIGDFLLCQKIHDHIALGSLFNPYEQHALSIVRDKMLRHSNLSRVPVTRNFAVDLRVPYLEIIEFAWMDDDSLIIACRRLHASLLAPEKPLVLSADIIFFPIIPSTDSNPLTTIPLLRMKIRESMAVCQFCGLRGVHACACPPSYKTRVYPDTDFVTSTPVPFDPTALPPTPQLLPFSSHTPSTNKGERAHDILSQALLSWHNYAQRIFKCNQVGAFFVQWFGPSRDGRTLEPFLSPRHPLPYQFVCGSKHDSLKLASLYIMKSRLCEKGVMAADMRLHDGSRRRQIEPRKVGETMDATTVLDMSVDGGIDMESGSTEPFGSYESCEEARIRSYSGLRKEGATEETLSPRAVLETEGGVTDADVDVDASASSDMARLDAGGRGESCGELDELITVNAENTPTCAECGRSFPKRGNLTRHIRVVHLGLKPFECKVCARRFGYKTHLKRHEMGHLRRSECV